MQTLLTQYSTILLLVGIAIALFALRNTIRNFNQSRHARYYILREEASARAGRWAIASFVSIAITLAILVFSSRMSPPPLSTQTPTTTARVSTAAASPTRSPSPTSSASPTASATASATLTPTATVAADVPEVLLTPIADAVEAAASARFEFSTLASRVEPDTFNPLDPGVRFPAGSTRVYVFFRATALNNGAPWGIFCYREGALVDDFVGLWEDGPVSQNSRAFCSLDGSEGDYSVSAYIGARRQFSIDFSLSGPAPTDTPAPATPTPQPPSETPTP
jgi:hypothetical protein